MTNIEMLEKIIEVATELKKQYSNEELKIRFHEIWKILGDIEEIQEFLNS